MNTIKWKPKAAKQLSKIDSVAAKKIRASVSTELIDLQTAKHVKALSNHQYPFRLRVGNYRVFFEYDGIIKIVSIEEVKKRDERTY